MSDTCIFCKIVRGEIPCSKVHEDDAVLAFMDIGPVVKGHTLVIPKAHYDPIINTPPAVLHHLIEIVQRVAAAHYTGLNADGVNVSQANGKAAGQIVPHIHFHVIPRFLADGHPRNWDAGSYDTPGEMQVYAGRIRGAFVNKG